MSLIDSGLRSPTGGATAQNDLAQNGRALPALGYMSLADDGRAGGLAPALQAHSIEHACRHRNLGLVELVHDVEPAPGKAVWNGRSCATAPGAAWRPPGPTAWAAGALPWPTGRSSRSASGLFEPGE